MIAIQSSFLFFFLIMVAFNPYLVFNYNNVIERQMYGPMIPLLMYGFQTIYYLTYTTFVFFFIYFLLG